MFVWGAALIHPLLLYLLYPIVGSSSNAIVMFAPVIATLAFSFRMGILFSVISMSFTVVVFYHYEPLGPVEVLPRIFLVFVVLGLICYGASKLRDYFSVPKKTWNIGIVNAPITAFLKKDFQKI